MGVKDTLRIMNEIVINVSVDCVIFGIHDSTFSVLLTRRELKDDQTGKMLVSDYTVQGHHVLKGENLNEAARRVLKEKTGLENIYLKQFYTFGDTDRLIREKDQIWRINNYPTVSNHVFSVGYFALVDSAKVSPDSDHPETKWFPVRQLPELGYDHKKIIKKALSCLRDEIRREPIGYELLPEKFTLSQLQQLFETVLDVKLDKRNFRKKVSQMKYIIALGENLSIKGNKPARLYIFSRDVYDKTKKDKSFIFM